MPTEAAPQPTPPAPEPKSALGDALPKILTNAAPAEVLDRLTTASRRGRLAGFEPNPPQKGLFCAAAHGRPFDSLLVGNLRGGELTFRLVLLRKLPLAFAAILVFTIWPGVYFMDELIAQLIPSWWSPWVTYYWYLPLTILPIPWMWKSTMARSRRASLEHARETIAGIAKEIGGTVQ